MDRGYSGSPIVLNDLQLRLLAYVASGKKAHEAADEIHISHDYAYQLLQGARQLLDAPTLPAAVMRAHAIGKLSHPTGYDNVVVILDDQLPE